MTPKKSLYHSLWNALCSLKLTLFVLIMLALTSIIGTVIQQNRSSQEYLQLYGERLTRLFESLQFFDMYSSWWFLGLLILFCLNLTACSIRRLPRVWLTVSRPPLEADADHFRSLNQVTEFTNRNSPDDAAERLRSVLGRHFSRPTMRQREGRIYLFAQKAPWARFGVYVTHLSILIIFAGAIIGNIWGFKAYVNIVEGTAESQVWPRGSDVPMDLGFAVRCDDFNVTYYEGSNRPKEFMSILDVVDGNEEVVSDRKIIVNDPLSYKGITFYQSSYGTADSRLRMRIRPKGDEAFEASGRTGEHIALPNGGSFAVNGYAPDYQGLGPAVQMHVNTPDGTQGSPFIVFQNYPEFDARRGGDYSFSLLDYQEIQYTGLEVKKDPGVWVVWTGCLLLVLGSMVAFMVAHRRLWAVVEPSESSSLIRIGGHSHRNRAAFELFFDELSKTLKKELQS